MSRSFGFKDSNDSSISCASMSAKVKFSLSPNLKLSRRGSTSPLECGEKKSPLFRRGSLSPNLRLLRRASDSNFLKDSHSLVRNVSLFSVIMLLAYLLGLHEYTKLLDNIHLYKFIILSFVCIRMLQS